MSKSLSPSVRRPVTRNWLRQAGFATLAAATLAGCGDARPVGAIGHVQGFGGLVAADEPRAVVVARDVLSAGGTAADAAVALYFTMAVTQPSTASLGGGGVCVVHDRDKKKTEVMEFFAPPSSVTGARAPNAVPANVRGFYALHAKYGKMRWESLLGEAERLARLGAPVSRAFATDLARAAQGLANDPQARRIFLPQGRPLAEGEMLEQLDLAATLGRIRRGAGDFYVGGQGRELAQAVTQAGGSLTTEDLRDIKPQFRDALTVRIGDEIAHFAPPPAVAGAVAAQITAALVDRWVKTAEDERPHLLAETAARAFAERKTWMQPNGWPNAQAAGLTKPERAAALLAGYSPDRHTPVQADKPTEALPAAGFVVMDSVGRAVACNVTTYGLFGNGKVAPGSGIVLAGVPGPAGPPAIGPVLVVNPHVHEVQFAAAASGGVTAPSALAQAVLMGQVEKRKLDQVMAMPRVHHSGQPDLVAVESGEYAGDAGALAKRGHEVRTVPFPSRVNAFQCDSGAPSFSRCRAAVDPRGNGLAVVVGRD